jgi:hypothetical protein
VDSTGTASAGDGSSLAAAGGWRDDGPSRLKRHVSPPTGHQQVGNQPMPEISRFFGIIIRMFMEVGAPHHRPHFHAAYQNAKGVFALDPVECIGGDLPRTQQRLVEAWAEIHLEELLQDWTLLQSGQPPIKIEPLR